MQPDDTMIILGPRACNEFRGFSTIDESNRAVVLEEQVVGDLTNGRSPLVSVPTDGEQ
jgi:hypothetical protein